jgi:hypothetical protein
MEWEPATNQNKDLETSFPHSYFNLPIASIVGISVFSRAIYRVFPINRAFPIHRVFPVKKNVPVKLLGTRFTTKFLEPDSQQLYRDTLCPSSSSPKLSVPYEIEGDCSNFYPLNFSEKCFRRSCLS